MPLDRHQQVAQIWNWLPAFRAVAEYESIQRASLTLAVSPSALSRSIKLLEQTLGLVLFSRSPSGMSLTADGSRLLTATREAMRRIDEGLTNAAPARLCAAAASPALQPLLCEATTGALVGVALCFSDVGIREVGERLRCGDLDVVLTHAPVPGRQINVEKLPALDMVLASCAGEGGTGIACLDAPGLQWPDATLTSANLDQLIGLGRRLPIAVFAPAYAVPEGWTVLEHRAPLPVFMVIREYSGAPPHFVAEIGQALRARLTRSSSTVGVPAMG